MSIFDELNDQQPPQGAETTPKRRRPQKSYKYYIAVGAMKKYGFTQFVLPDGSMRTLDELLKHPVVPDANKPIYIPLGDGSVVDLDGNVILKAKKE